MQAFVSGQLKEKKAVRGVYARLAKMGIGVTHDWTCTDNLEAYSKNSKEASVRADRDIRGICDADVYVLMTDNKLRGKGMYVELGAALALAKVRGSPKIFVVGPLNHASIFYYHPLVLHFPDIDSCLDHISQIGAHVSQYRRRKQVRREAA